jgi:CRISPR-associated protein Csx17
VPGFGLRSLRQVLADVLVWRSRTAADEHDSQQFRGVPTFQLGVPVPAADLHAFALGLLDEADLDLWLRACLALDWRGVRPPWKEQPVQVAPIPTLGLLQPLAHGFAPAGGRHDAPKRAMEPDWAGRLAAGQLGAVHHEALARLRQAGWQAVPFQPPPDAIGADFAAALVPRCCDPRSMMRRYLAIKLRDEPAGGAYAESAEDIEVLAPQTTELAKELA